jgi:predicted transcriptional regulator of viral defense system
MGLAQYLNLFVVLCMAESRTEALRRLYEVAEDQQGLFTTKQAKGAGFAENTHPYHVQAGNWIRQHRGIYRLALFPATEHPDLVQWALWSRNRREETEGVYSHETALSLWELSDVNPSKLHITVPKNFRRNSKPPSILVLHYANVPQGDIEVAQGYKFTKPLRTILDVIEADSASKDIVRQAIRQAFERGLINRKQISSAKMKDSVRKLFEGELRRGTQ